MKGMSAMLWGRGWVDEFSMLKCLRLKKPIQLNAENIIKISPFECLTKGNLFTLIALYEGDICCNLSN